MVSQAELQQKLVKKKNNTLYFIFERLHAIGNYSKVKLTESALFNKMLILKLATFICIMSTKNEYNADDLSTKPTYIYWQISYSESARK